MANEEKKINFCSVLGPNTKQWWVYLEDKDVYVDPPKEVLDTVNEHPYAEQESVLDSIVEKNPSWLYDREYWYSDIEI